MAFAWNGEKQDNFDVYVMATRSGTPLRLTTNPADDLSPAWSPDGRMLAYLRRLNDDRAELRIVAATGGPEHKLAETKNLDTLISRKFWSVAWSPDGHWVAVSGREPDDFYEHIYLFSLTGEKRQLTSPPRGTGFNSAALELLQQISEVGQEIHLRSSCATAR